MLIFSTPEQVSLLQSSTDFLTDGTFEVCDPSLAKDLIYLITFFSLQIVPEIFYQLYVVHAVHRQEVVPEAFCLLRRKNGTTYQQMIEHILRFAPTWNSQNLMLDFGKAASNSFSEKFPQASLSGCYFHLRQSLHRQLQVRAILKLKT
jgi:hypothetical protein